MTKGKSYRRLLSLLFIAGILIFAAATLTLGIISEDIIDHRPLNAADVQFSNWLYAHHSPSLRRAMFVATSLGSTATVTCVAVGLGLYLLWRRRLAWLSVLGASLGGGMLLNRLLKYAFHRPRPHFDDPILTLTSYSFPSGHTMAATALYGVIAAYLLSRTSNWSWRLIIIFVAATLIALVAFSRIYLGAHYLTDVLAAMAEGFAWLSLSLTMVYSIRSKATLC
ncbi:MAG: phosphatase PAP2 family protein [Pyrinomonadaceae bacterium]